MQNVYCLHFEAYLDGIGELKFLNFWYLKIWSLFKVSLGFSFHYHMKVINIQFCRKNNQETFKYPYNGHLVLNLLKPGKNVYFPANKADFPSSLTKFLFSMAYISLFYFIYLFIYLLVLLEYPTTASQFNLFEAVPV